MSRAFVKEDEGQRWSAPTDRTYRLIWAAEPGHEVLHETDDLLDALNWLWARERSGFQLRDRGGTLLALNG